MHPVACCTNRKLSWSGEAMLFEWLSKRTNQRSLGATWRHWRETRLSLSGFGVKLKEYVAKKINLSYDRAYRS